MTAAYRMPAYLMRHVPRIAACRMCMARINIVKVVAPAVKIVRDTPTHVLRELSMP